MPLVLRANRRRVHTDAQVGPLDVAGGDTGEVGVTAPNTGNGGYDPPGAVPFWPRLGDDYDFEELAARAERRRHQGGKTDGVS